MAPGNTSFSPVRRIAMRAICSGLIVTLATGLSGCVGFSLIFGVPYALNPHPSLLCSTEQCGQRGNLLHSTEFGNLLEMESGHEEFVLGDSGPISGFEFAESDEGLLLYGAAEDGLRIYDGVVPGTLLDTIEVPDCGPLGDVVVLDDGRVVVSCMDTGRLVKIDPGPLSIVEDFSCCDEAIEPFNSLALALSPDGSMVLAGDEQIQMFDTKTGEFLGVAVEVGILESTSYDDFLFGPDGNLYVSANPDVGVIRFDGRTLEFLDVFVPAGVGDAGGSIFGLAFDERGNLFLSICCSMVGASILEIEGETGALVAVVDDQLFTSIFLNFRP